MIRFKRMMVDRLIRYFRVNENMEFCRRNRKRELGRVRNGVFYFILRI